MEPGSRLTLGGMRMKEWISAEISRAILEELPRLVEQITNRLIIRYEEQVIIAQTIKEKKKEAQGREPIPETHLGKRKRAPESVSLTSARTPKDANTSVGKDYVICANCGGTHGYACHKFHCRKCKQKGHVRRDCPQVGETCNHCRQIGHIKANCPELAGETVQAPAPAP